MDVRKSKIVAMILLFLPLPLDVYFAFPLTTYGLVRAFVRFIINSVVEPVDIRQGIT